MEDTSGTGKIRWHRLLGKLFEELLIPVGVSVYTEFPVMSQSPEADILLLRKTRGEWTPGQLERLPDGMRSSKAKHILIEFKYTESIRERTFRQLLGYDTFYKSSRKLKDKDVQSFVISAKNPRDETLDTFGYRPGEKKGIYRSGNPLLETIPLLSLNELSNEPHNAYIKCFASRKKQKKSAFDILRQQGLREFHAPFQWFMEGLWHYWFTAKGDDMKPTDLTPEQVTEIGKIWADTILSSLPADEVLSRYGIEERLKGLKPEDRLKGLKAEDLLKGLKPEDRLKGLKPEDRLKGLEPEVIDAYLRKIRKKP